MEKRLNYKGQICLFLMIVWPILCITLITFLAVTWHNESNRLQDCYTLNYTCDADNAVFVLNLKIDDVDPDRIFKYNVPVSRYCAACCDKLIDRYNGEYYSLYCIVVDDALQEVKYDTALINACAIFIVITIIACIIGLCKCCIVVWDDDTKYHTQINRTSQKVLTREAKFIIAGSVVWWIAFAILLPYTIYGWYKHVNSQEGCDFYGHQCDAEHGVNSLYFKTENNVYTFNVTVPLGCQTCCDIYSPFGKYRNGYCIIDNDEMVDYSEKGGYEMYILGVIMLVGCGIPVWLLGLLSSPYTCWERKNYSNVELNRIVERPTALDEDERPSAKKV